VCQDCGQVLDGIYLPTMSTIKETFVSDNELMLDKIRLIAARLFIEQESIIHKIFLLIRKITRQDHAFDENEIIAYALWETLNREKVPQSPKDIAHVCEIKTIKLLEMTKFFYTSTTSCPPESYVSRICELLNVPFKIQKIVTVLLADITYCGIFKPESMVVACLIVLADYLREKNPYFLPHVSEKCIRKTCPSFLSRSCLKYCRRLIGERELQTLTANLCISHTA